MRSQSSPIPHPVLQNKQFNHAKARPKHKSLFFASASQKRRAMPTKQCHGSCMCGKVKYEANLDFSNGTGKCNCSTCLKLRLWFIRARPADFTLISGEDYLTNYVHKSDWHQQLFCKHCGVHAFHKLDRPQIGGEWYSIAINTLDDVEPAEMASWKVNYYDGRNDNYRNSPEHKEIY